MGDIFSEYNHKSRSQSNFQLFWNCDDHIRKYDFGEKANKVSKYFSISIAPFFVRNESDAQKRMKLCSVG